MTTCDLTRPGAPRPAAPGSDGARDVPGTALGWETWLAKLDDLLSSSCITFIRISEDTWVGYPTFSGADYVRIEALAERESVRLRFDTGIRVPAGEVLEVNKLMLLSNIMFRVTGFDLLCAGESDITFTYRLANTSLAQNQECMPQGWEQGVDLPLRGRELLETTLSLAMNTITEFTELFNAVIYGGIGALCVHAL